MIAIITICIAFCLSYTNAQLECRQISFESIQVNLNGVRVAWTVDNDCATTYTISHYIGDELNTQTVIPHPVSATWLNRVNCTKNNVTIHTRTRPDRGEIDPISTGFYVECEECHPVNVDFEVLDEQIRVYWTTNPCAVLYRVTHLIDGEIANVVAVPHPVSSVQIARRSCSKSQIIVSSIALEPDREFDDVLVDVAIGLDGDGSVQNLRYNSDTGNVEWEAPDAPDWCELEFLVEFSNEHENRETRTNNTFYDLPVYPCTTNYVNVTTRVVTLGEYAASKDLVHNESVPDDIQVRNLRFDDESSRFVWDPPQNTQHCDIQYMVDFTNELQNENQNLIINEYFEILNHPCSTNKIEVTTSIYFKNHYYSEPVTKIHYAPIDRTLPLHIYTIPFETGAAVMWYNFQEGPTVCVVTDFYFTITEEGATYSPDHISIKHYLEQVGYLKHEFDGLEEGSVYDYQLCFKFEQNPEVPLCTKTITFPTTTLEDPQIDVNTTSSSQIGVSWTTNGKVNRFITGHTVSIEPLRTKHFTPSHCEMNWNLSKEVRSDVPPDVTSVVFEDPYPSFVYNVTVTTHFGGLGIDRTTMEEDVVTIETTPGYLDIETSYNYVPSTLYNVALKAKWGIPCYANGAVRSFAYTLRGQLESDDHTVICEDVVFGTGIIDLFDEDFDVSVMDPIYEIEIPDLLPFFNYSLSVRTNLYKHYSTTEIQLDEVPPAYSPVSYSDNPNGFKLLFKR